MGLKDSYRIFGFVPCKIQGLTFKPNKNSPSINLSGEPLYLDLVKGEARITLAFRNKQGKVFGYIIDNEWHLSSKAIFEHNFNENTLEVIGLDNEIMLQIRINGHKILLAGDFYGKGPNPGVMKFRPYAGHGAGLKARLFKYPSCSHPGELIQQH